MAKLFTQNTNNYLSTYSGFDLLDGSTAYSFSAWVKPADNSATVEAIVEKFPASARGCGLRQSSGKVRFHIIDAGATGREVTGVTNMALGQWNHVGGGWHGSGGVLSCVLNGVVDANSGVVTHTATEPTDFTIGREFGATNPYNGSIAEVAVWKGVFLSDPDWASLGSQVSPLTIQSSFLIAYWPLCGFDASTHSDVSGNGNHLTPFGTLPYDEHPFFDSYCDSPQVPVQPNSSRAAGMRW